ncbi:MAG: hypothetical protein IPK50_05130 [Fibrobacterota bacterium]|nr:MAG: hypothetical protein IPK50_05130 [Fibrobacterota bacterium]
MVRSHLLIVLGLALPATTFALSLGGGVGAFGGEVSEAKTEAKPYSFSGTAFGVKVVDPSGSLLSLMSNATGNYGRMLGAQQRAKESAEKGGDGKATYEARTSVNSTGSTQTLEVLWVGSGEFTNQDLKGKEVTDSDADILAIQGSLLGQITSWNGLGGLPLSVVAQFRMVMGYYDLMGKDPSGYQTEKNKMWITIPFGAAVVYDAPAGISVWGSAGYDPITGVISIFSTNVHQAWELGAGATWQPLGWLAVDAAWEHRISNVDNNDVWKFTTDGIQAQARIDFDGF